jgi:hypothetical protein
MGNGLRLRIIQNDGHKAKTRKENQIMKNRNIQFKPKAGLLIPLLLACFAAVFVSATTPASASHQVPFNAAFSTEFEFEIVYPFLYLSVTGQGIARHMGATTAITTNQIVNLEDGSATATYTLTGANGDTVVLDMIFQTTFISEVEVTFAGDYTVAGGSGRFSGATGSGALAGSAIITGPNNGVGSFSVAGTISSPGH